MSNPELTPAQRYHALMLLFAGVALAVVPLLVWAVEHADLPWYLHIPVVGLCLTLLPGGGGAAGWAYYQYEQARRQEAGADHAH